MCSSDLLWYDKNGNVTNEFRESDKVMTGKTYDAPWMPRIEPEHHCRHRHHGNGLADSDVPALLLRENVYEQSSF